MTLFGLLLGALVLWVYVAEPQTSPDPAKKPVGDNLTTESYVTKVKAPSCKTEEMMHKLSHFLTASDHDAFQKYLAERLATDDCELLPKGTKVFLEETNLLGYWCVRVRGHTGCGYVAREWIEPIMEDAPDPASKPIASAPR